MFSADQIVAHLVGSCDVRPIVSAAHLPNQALRHAKTFRHVSLRDRPLLTDHSNIVGCELRGRMILASEQWLGAFPRRPVLWAARNVTWAALRPMTTTINHVLRVLSGGAKLKVVRVAASRRVASVPDQKIRIESAKRQSICDTMRSASEAFTVSSAVEKPVAIARHCATPQPAFVGRAAFNFLPEARGVSLCVSL